MDAENFDLSRAVGMAQAAQLIRGKGGRLGVAVDTVRRWANPTKGCSLPRGKVAVLRTVRWCGEILTLPEWIEEFERERTAHLRQPPLPFRSRRSREASHRRACEELRRMGIG